MSFDLRLFGNKLTRCRKQLQLEIEEVANGTGSDAKRVKDFEDGLVEPSGDEILIFADFFKQDYNFFISNEQKSAYEQIDILYRKFGSEISKRDRWIIKEFIFQCECEEYVLNAIELTRTKFIFEPQGDYFKQHGYDAALRLRETLGFKENQIIADLYYQLRKIGIHIFRRRLDNSNISGLFVNHPNAGRCVLVNYDEDVFRQNFTVAHEAAHAIFDFKDNINISFAREDLRNLREIRANSFAANFLVPKEFLKKNQNIAWTEEHVFNTALKLKVNPQVLLISLKETKMISDSDYNRLRNVKIPIAKKQDPELAEVSDKVQKSKETLLDIGLSTFYVRNCYEAYTRGIISANKMAEMLLISDTELPRILKLFNLKLRHEN